MAEIELCGLQVGGRNLIDAAPFGADEDTPVGSLQDMCDAVAAQTTGAVGLAGMACKADAGEVSVVDVGHKKAVCGSNEQ